jgi:hypothetical protein
MLPRHLVGTNPTGPLWPVSVDVTRASAARVYDYYLGGDNNFGVDRELARAVMARVPVVAAARENRAFLRRVVSELVAGCGVRQLLDLGSGIPTRGPVHEVAHRIDPGVRVAYVDSDPVAVAHAGMLLRDVPNVVAVGGDLRDPLSVVTHPVVRSVIDLSEPVGVLMVAVLHFVPDGDDPAGVVATYRDLVAAGSFVAISHATADHGPAGLDEAVGLYAGSQSPCTLRSHAEVRELFSGWPLAEPGVVPTAEWRPDHRPGHTITNSSMAYGGLGYLP